MLNKEIDTPFRPRIEKGIFDVSNFDEKYTKAPPTDSPANSIDCISASQAPPNPHPSQAIRRKLTPVPQPLQTELFAGFSYVRSCSPIPFSPSTGASFLSLQISIPHHRLTRRFTHTASNGINILRMDSTEDSA